MATLIHGANNSGSGTDLSRLLPGKTVAEVRELFADIYNIPDNATPTINGRAVSEGAVVGEYDELVFAKPTGSKG